VTLADALAGLGIVFAVSFVIAVAFMAFAWWTK